MFFKPEFIFNFNLTKVSTELIIENFALDNIFLVNMYSVFFNSDAEIEINIDNS